ncbi:hypothetical protein MVEN_01299700 [Mycena venus]|uniref:Uncharacterized protein n=1 Tax=Mycena venus TaxID=2733690 RepID=A0A8H6Y111_9AGAR|nr:hypothetical protein MVEN_01299700 [Mycena venus]
MQFLSKSFVANALGVYFCNDVNFVTDCAHWTNLVSGNCYTLDAEHQNALSSFGPDAGTGCSLYDDYHCADSPCTNLENPGSTDLSHLPPGGGPTYSCNDQINSFKCHSV